MQHNNQYYPSYLRLEQLLDCQHPLSFEEGQEPAHDEMLFIIIHQAYELWFKQMLFELEYVKKVFSKDTIAACRELLPITFSGFRFFFSASLYPFLYKGRPFNTS